MANEAFPKRLQAVILEEIAAGKKPGRSRVSPREGKLTLGLLLTRLLILVTLLATLTWLLLAGLLTGLLLPTTALLATLSGLLVLLTAALSALILISHDYCYSCGDYSHQENIVQEAKFRGVTNRSTSKEPSTVAIVAVPTFGQPRPSKRGA